MSNKIKCRICGKGAFEIKGYLERINERGVPGIWECRPSCDAKLTNEQAIISAIKGPLGQAMPVQKGGQS